MVQVLDLMDFVFGQICWAWNRLRFTTMCYGVSSGPDGFCLRAGLLGLEPTLFHTHVLWCKFWTRWILSSGRSVGPGTNAVSLMCYGVSSGPDGFCLRAGLLGLEPTLFHTHVLWCTFWTQWILSSGRSVGSGTNAVSLMCFGVSSGPDGFCLRAGLLGLEPTLFHTQVLWCKFWT